MKKIIVALLTLAVLILGSYYFLKNTTNEVNQNMPVSLSTQNQEDLKIEDLEVGQGQEIKEGDTVQVHYLGTLTNGEKFDSSYDRNQPFEFQVGAGQVIQGWDQGLLGMRIGGKRKLTIPSYLGYGNQSAGSIPPNSTLIFEVELIDIK